MNSAAQNTPSPVSPLQAVKPPTTRRKRSLGWIYNAKNILLFLIPISLSLYTLSLFTTFSGMEILSWLSVGLALIYIVIDRLARPHEFSFFSLAVDIPVILLILVVITGLLTNPAPAGTDLVDEVGWLRWIPLTYLLAFSFRILPALNRSLHLVLGMGALISGYAVIQHFTGIDLLTELGLRAQTLAAAPTDPDTFSVVGFFSHPTALGFVLVQLIGFPLAALLLGQRRPPIFRWSMLGLVALTLVACFWTYSHGVWIAALAALITVPAFVGRRYLIMLGIFAAVIVFFGTRFSPDFHSHVSTLFVDPELNAGDRRDVWHANIKMFEDNPWFGVGVGRNGFRLPEYYQSLGITKSTQGAPLITHAHNTYFQWLATTGLFGFASYMLIVMVTLLMSLRLWNEIPQTHYWHRVFVLGSLAAQIATHTGGLTNWNLGIPEVNHMFVFILAWTLYLGARYEKDIIPDDSSL